MLKKTHSKNEFRDIKSGTFLHRIRNIQELTRNLIVRHPFYALACMFACMLISAILAFTVMRVNESTKLPKFPGLATHGIIKSSANIIDTYAAMGELEELKQRIALIIQKDSLSHLDSIQLTEALKRYEKIQRNLLQ